MKANKYRSRFSLISSGKGSEEKQIFLVATIEGTEVFYYSGYRIHPENFVKQKVTLKNSTIYVQQVKNNAFNKAGDSASIINARLKELDNASFRVYERNYKDKGIEVSKDEYRKLLQIELGEWPSEGANVNSSIGFFEAYDKYLQESNVSEGRKKLYKVDINKLKTYELTLKNNISFDNFDIDSYKKYISKDRASNTVVVGMKRIKAFYNFCIQNGIINKSPFDKIKFATKIGSEQYNEPVCMTRSELTHLYTIEIRDYRSCLARDMFCLQAAIGCRVGDFLRLTYDNIENDVLVYFPSKTQEYASKVVVPLSKRAKDILSKYKGQSRNNLLMPFLNSIEYNALLKNVFKLAELDRVIIQYDRDKKQEVIYKLWDFASSHLARRTFVDILCQAGEPIHVVASMSGHSETSKAFDRYRRRPEQLQIKAVNRSMD